MFTFICLIVNIGSGARARESDPTTLEYAVRRKNEISVSVPSQCGTPAKRLIRASLLRVHPNRGTDTSEWMVDSADDRMRPSIVKVNRIYLSVSYPSITLRVG